ncbi:MAG: winged helix-turn-helix transcriptional regulator [Deltaproteobacteria bacterium]|nr:winged helix-turn-helix transcriptional regulator [Deltaproteobacteria bacterium]MBW2307652.1 winged helix-turn-helix transcriptional regulator [Deltaproteobacteria bacterium]
MKKYAELFKVLAVDKRIEIIELLKNGEMSVNSLAGVIGITQSAISQHLRILKSAGLVNDERRGYRVFYSLNVKRLETCRQQLDKICTCGCLQKIKTPSSVMKARKE